MCMRKGYILTLGYEKGAIWVKNWYIKGEGFEPWGGDSPC